MEARKKKIEKKLRDLKTKAPFAAATHVWCECDSSESVVLVVNKRIRNNLIKAAFYFIFFFK